MSGSTTPAATTPPMSADLKSAIISAAQAHLAQVTSDVSRITTAVQGDLAGVATVGQNELGALETSILGEIGKLRADVAGVPLKYYAIGVGVTVAGAAGLLAHFVMHLF